MTISKTAMTISSLAMAMLFGGGLYLFMNMNILAKNYLERIGSETLGVSVSIGSLDINLQDRKASVRDLVIGNPEGFEKRYAVRTGTITMALGGITKPLIDFNDIDVRDTEINLEVKENVTNLSAIRNRVKPAAESDPQNIRKIIIDRLTLSQAQIKPSSVLFTDEEVQPLTVPDVILTEIGRKENGVQAREAIAQVWIAVSHKIEVQALHAGLLEGVSPEALQDMGLGTLQRFRENLQDSVQKRMDSVNENIDRIFTE